MVGVRLAVTNDHFARLEAIAAAGGMSADELARRAVDSLLSASPAPPERRDEAITAIGGLRSRSRDESHRHHENLARAYLARR